MSLPFHAVTPEGPKAREGVFHLPAGTLDRRMRVLVVEDDPVQALLITLLLDRLAVASVLVRNGAQALEAVKREHFSLVLMDYLMPVLDGVEATRQIRGWELDQGVARLPIVAVTASAMADECRRYINAGMDEVLLKPFAAQELGALLGRYAPASEGLARRPGPDATPFPWRPSP
jgi:two-component system sensor histidine kinase EvgS